LEKVVDEIEERTEKIWKKSPPEIDRIQEPKGPYCQSFTGVIYAYFDANALAGTLWTLRKNAKAGVTIDSLTTVTQSILETHAVSFEAYGLEDSAKLLRKVSVALENANNSKEFVTIVEKLVAYLNRLGMSGWLDLIIPWQRLSCAFEEAISLRSLKKIESE
jgi:hypothetical protein